MSTNTNQSMASLLECSICLEPFNDPRMLKCLHTLCYSCLRDHITHSGQNKQFHCPECRTCLDIPEEGADAFPKHFFINKCMNIVSDTGSGARSKTGKVGLRRRRTPDSICSNSEDGDDCTQTEEFCIDCCEYYCKACSKAHRKSKASRSHVQVAIEKLTDQMLRDAILQSETPRCLQHNNGKLKLYCSTCDCAICTTCSQSSHKSHNFTTITAVDEDLKSELGIAKEELGHMITEVRKQSDHDTKTQEKSDATISTATATMKGVFQKMHHMLDQKAAEIAHKISQIKDDRDAKTDIQTKNLTLQVQLLESLHLFVHDLIHKGNAYNRLASMSEVRGHLQRFYSSSEDQQTSNVCTQVEVPGSMDIIVNSLNNLVLEEEVKLDNIGSEAACGLKITQKCSITPDKVDIQVQTECLQQDIQTKKQDQSAALWWSLTTCAVTTWIWVMAGTCIQPVTIHTSTACAVTLSIVVWLMVFVYYLYANPNQQFESSLDMTGQRKDVPTRTISSGALAPRSALSVTPKLRVVVYWSGDHSGRFVEDAERSREIDISWVVTNYLHDIVKNQQQIDVIYCFGDEIHSVKNYNINKNTAGQRHIILVHQSPYGDIAKTRSALGRQLSIFKRVIHYEWDYDTSFDAATRILSNYFRQVKGQSIAN